MPRYQEKKTFCAICESSCGLIATIKDDSVVSLRADESHPNSQGFACSKGLNYHALIKDPDRVIYPMRRSDNGEFKRATWEEAFADIGKRLRGVQRKYGNESIGLAWGNPLAVNHAAAYEVQNFLRYLDTKHHYNSGSLDVANYWYVSDLLYGNSLVNAIPDFKNTDFALILGANPVVSHGSYVCTGNIRNVLSDIPKRGGRVVVVDPRRSETAALFEHHFIRPGTDVWLLGALLKVLFDEKRVDYKKIKRKAKGLDALIKLVAKLDINRAADECGISAETIHDLAVDLANAKSACIYGRCGTSLSRFSSLTKYFLDALAIVTGNIDQRGGMIFGDPMIDMEKVVASSGISGVSSKTSRVDKLPILMNATPYAALSKEITTPGDGQLKALVTVSANPVISAPGSKQLDQALPELELLVCLDPYITETSRHADWILPPTLAFEREILPIHSQALFAVPNAQWVKPLVPGAGETKDDSWILRHLINELDSSLLVGFAKQVFHRLDLMPTAKTAYDVLLRIGEHGDWFGLKPKGLSRRKILDNDGAIKLANACPDNVLKKKIYTKDKMIHLDHPFVYQEIDRLINDISEPMSDQDGSVFDMKLFSIRELRSQNSFLHNIPKLTLGKKPFHIRINPINAVDLGLADLEKVKLISPWGEVVAPVKMTDEVMSGCLGMPHGWGHNGGWKHANSLNSANYNVLSPTDPSWLDKPSGNATFNGIPVRIEKISYQNSALNGQGDAVNA